MRGLLGLLAAIVMFCAVGFAALYGLQVLTLGAQTRLAEAQAERLEAQALLQQAQTIDYLARAQAHQVDRLLIALALLGVLALFAVLLLAARQPRPTYYPPQLPPPAYIIVDRPVQQAAPEEWQRQGARHETI